MQKIFPGFPQQQDQDMFGIAGGEWKETPQGYEMKFNITGLTRDKIDVQVEEGLITISGQGSGSEAGTSPDGRYRAQQFHSFMQTFPLPEGADPLSVKTDFKDDELIIRLGKKKP